MHFKGISLKTNWKEGDTMPDYGKMYQLLFNAITDALRRLDAGDEIAARALLIDAQQQTEALYIEAEDAGLKE